MPEGDTIHKLAAVLRDEVVGHALTEARLAGHRIESFLGRPVDAVRAHGKHLFIEVGDRALRTHLGRAGSWHRYAPGRRWQQPCSVCGDVIRHARMGRHNRSTYWCPRCQAATAIQLTD